MSAKNNQNDTPSIQEKMQQLQQMVAWFQGDDFVLEQALDKYKAAEKLANEIEADLAQIKNDIDVVKQRFDQAG